MTSGIFSCRRAPGQSASLSGTLAALLLFIPSSIAAPRVTFDTNFTVSCVEVTPDEDADSPGATKLIDATFRVSTLVDGGALDDVEEIIVTINSPARSLRVVDFSPRTELTSDISGEIEVVKTTEKTGSLDASIGGAISIDYGMIKAQASPAAGAGTTKRNALTETYNKLPPGEVVVSSGTTNREHGVFFKLRPSFQSTLEGLREFTCRFVVEEAWRGDWVVLECRAKAFGGVSVFRKLEVCGHRQTYVGLHMAGDPVAGAAAARLAEAQALVARAANEQEPRGLHVVMRPLFSSSGSEPGVERTGFGVPALFGFGRGEAEAADSRDHVMAATVRLSPADELEVALEALRQLSGDRLSTPRSRTTAR